MRDVNAVAMIVTTIFGESILAWNLQGYKLKNALFEATLVADYKRIGEEWLKITI